MKASDTLTLWLYIFIIPLVANGTKEGGASEGMSYFLALIWPIAYIIGIFWIGVTQTWASSKRSH